MSYIIVNNKGRNINNKLYKNKNIAQKAKEKLIKNNSLEQRKMVGFVGLKIKKVKPFKQEEERLKEVKEFIFR